MFGMLKMLPLILVLAAAGWGYHTVTLNNAEKQIAQLESNNSVLKTNQIQLEQAIETEKKSRAAGLQDATVRRRSLEAAGL